MSLKKIYEEQKEENKQDENLVQELMQKLQEEREEKQRILSNNLMLKKELQNKSEKINYLNEQIGKHAESDNVLKQNKELKLQNKKLKEEKENTLKEAEAEVLSVKKEYAKKEYNIEWRIEEAEKRLEEARKVKNNQEQLIDKKVDAKYKVLKESLENKVNSEILAIKGVFIGSILYGVLCTMFAGMHSERFRIDFTEFFIGIKGFTSLCIEKLFKTAKTASQIGDMISQEVISVLVKGLVWLVVLLVLAIIVVAIMVLLIKMSIDIYKKISEKCKHFTKINLAIMLFTLAVSAYFGDSIRTVIPFNLAWMTLLLPVFVWLIIGILVGIIGIIEAA